MNTFLYESPAPPINPSESDPGPIHIDRAEPMENFRDYVILEDDHLIAINKPPGLSTCGDSLFASATDIVRLNCPAVSDARDVSPVHRLDKLTSGVLVFGKTKQARRYLSKQFARDRAFNFEKGYVAIVRGDYGSDRFIELYLDDRQVPVAISPSVENAKLAQTVVTKIANTYSLSGEQQSLVAVQTLTGRTHQIRATLASLGNPILGDPIYGDRRGRGRMRLHAQYLKLAHPASKETIQLTAPVSNDFFTNMNSEEAAHAQYLVSKL
jgi:23S rRNA pseudouridine1911/1915/1917 synthase